MTDNSEETLLAKYQRDLAIYPVSDEAWSMNATKTLLRQNGRSSLSSQIDDHPFRIAIITGFIGVLTISLFLPAVYAGLTTCLIF